MAKAKGGKGKKVVLPFYVVRVINIDIFQVLASGFRLGFMLAIQNYEYAYVWPISYSLNIHDEFEGTYLNLKFTK